MSLFGDSSSDEDDQATETLIPGLFLFPSLLTSNQSQLALKLSMEIFKSSANQVMLFGANHFPSFLNNSFSELSKSLISLPPSIHSMLFDSELTQQVICNLYRPGEGISPHVDLLERYSDGIIAVSLLGSVVMELTRVPDEGEKNESDGEIQEKENGTSNNLSKKLLLRPGSVLILTGEARYKWNHGIIPQFEDNIIENGEQLRILRGLRMSITFRRMLKGADIVGEEEAGIRE